MEVVVLSMMSYIVFMSMILMRLMEFWGVTHYAFNTDTWELIEQSLQPKSWNVIATETAIDPKTGEVFGEFYSANLKSLEWGVIDYRTLTRTTIAKAEHSYIALGITNDGRAFGVADDGNLYQIDRTTGVETLKGSTGINVKGRGRKPFLSNWRNRTLILTNLFGCKTS